jgi:uncharacterized RDD family membrane protein YckC
VSTEAQTSNAADWGERTGAALVDLAIAAFAFLTGLVAGSIAVAAGGWGIALGALLILGGIAAAILYAPLMLARKGSGNGRTVGKRAANLRVVRDDASRSPSGSRFCASSSSSSSSGSSSPAGCSGSWTRCGRCSTTATARSTT